MKKMNILHVSTLAIWDLGKGKGRVSTYLPIKCLADRGHSQIYITSNAAQPDTDEDNISARHISVPFSHARTIWMLLFWPIFSFVFVYKTYKICKGKHFDLVYSHSTYTSLPAKILAWIFKAKYALKLYGIGSHGWKPAGIVLKLAMRIKADTFVLVNDGTKAKEFAMSQGVPENKIHFLRNGINKDVKVNIDDAFKKKYKNSDTKILLSISRLANSKNVDLIIKMVPELAKTDAKFHLIIVGDGPDRASLEKLVDDLQVREYVTFTGAANREEVFKFQAIADLFISMNNLSSMSNPVYESMICGKCVVALNKGGTTELVRDGYNGILIEPDKIDELPKVVYDLLMDDERRTKIGENAHDFLMNEWPSWDERVKQEAEILENLCSNNSDNEK